jgi:UTP--glucose-1-phosphate uridylyltransferase
MKVRKAVIPAAGFGTRFLPVTRSIPKEMIPIVDRPAVHYIVEEAAQAGIEHIVFVISTGKEAVYRYFDRLPDLEDALERQRKDSMLRLMREISNMAEISYVIQKQQLGLGHAVLTARAAVGEEPFAVFLPDDIIWADAPTIGGMIEIFAEYEGSVIAVKEVPDEAVSSLGIVNPGRVDGSTLEIAGLVEKPKLEDAPSNLAIIGRYVLTPEIFDALERVRPGAVGEIQLTDAIAALLSTQKAYAYRFPGVHFDVGTPLGMLKASVYAALQREGIAHSFREWLDTVVREREAV